MAHEYEDICKDWNRRGERGQFSRLHRLNWARPRQGRGIIGSSENYANELPPRRVGRAAAMRPTLSSSVSTDHPKSSHWTTHCR
jgi:hypothetical protein